MKIVIVCAFFESAMRSFRENQFAERLSKRGHQVKVITSDQSYIWRLNRARVRPTIPTSEDSYYQGLTNLQLIRRKPLIRVGDFVLLPLNRQDFRDADIVHVLDFRQGVTAVAARIAQSLGKPVVYDHEQRGDRVGSFLHRFDNLFRRGLIKFGGKAPNLVRHTVMANRSFFQQVVPSYVGEFALTPLGVNDKVFFKDECLRGKTRKELGLAEDGFMFLFSGKIDFDKRPTDVAKAMQRAGHTLFLAGKVSDGVKQALVGFSNVIFLGEKTQTELNALYNACDCAVFTTFSLSYWEALAAGANLIVPSTKFSKNILEGIEGVVLFGRSDMFEVEEERYISDFPVEDVFYEAITIAQALPRTLGDRSWLSWDEKIDTLEHQYDKLMITARSKP